MLKHFIDNVKDKMDVNCKMADGWTPFIYAAVNGYLLSVELLYKQGGCHINEVDKFNRTALHWVARYNNKQMVRKLLDIGVLHGSVDIEGLTAYDLAKQYNNYEIAQMIMLHKQTHDKRISNSGAYKKDK